MNAPTGQMLHFLELSANLFARHLSAVSVNGCGVGQREFNMCLYKVTVSHHGTSISRRETSVWPHSERSLSMKKVFDSYDSPAFK